MCLLEPPQTRSRIISPISLLPSEQVHGPGNEEVGFKQYSCFLASFIWGEKKKKGEVVHSQLLTPAEKTHKSYLAKKREQHTPLLQIPLLLTVKVLYSSVIIVTLLLLRTDSSFQDILDFKSSSCLSDMKLLRPDMSLLMCLNILWYNGALIFARILNFSSIAVNGNFFLMFHWSNSIGCYMKHGECS